ncbi:MAG: phage tail protein [Actinobacteria bacterium]|nr:phage tail protein [Actinomycetota bacterium]
MPLTKVTKLLELTDAKIAPLLTDPAGGSATYGALVDVPGILKIGLKPEVVKKVLNGDNQILDVWSKVTSIKLTVEHSKLSLDVLAIFMGGTAATAGTTPNQTATYDLLATDRPGYFKIEGKADYVEDGVGDAHVLLHKVKCDDPSDWEFADASGDFAKMKTGATAIPLVSNSKIIQVKLNETAAAIS